MPYRGRFDRWLALVLLARILLFGNFMVVAATVPVLRESWGIGNAEIGALSSGFLFGYALSLLIFSWLADRIGACRVVRISAALSALSAAAFGLLADNYAAALVLYALAGLTQGGVYTPLIMVFSDRYDRCGLGGKVGWLIASTSVGYAASLILSAAAMSVDGYRMAFVLTGVMPALGAALLLWTMRHDPNRIHQRESRDGLFRYIARNRPACHLLSGYTAHCWELLGMWAWIPAFLAANLQAHGGSGDGERAAYLATGLHIVGAVAAWSMGGLSDTWGRPRVLVLLGLLGAACSFAIGWTVALPTLAVTAFCLIYAFAAIGDSPVLSVAIAETVDPARLGAVLALRSLLGFGIGGAAATAFGWTLDATNADPSQPDVWWPAFAVIGIGGLVATFHARAFNRSAVGR